MTDRPLSKILDALRSITGFDPKRNGQGWIARCPAHDDHNPSLSITEADDRRVLFKCHAGCSVDAICDALNIRKADLFPERGDGYRRGVKPPSRSRTKAPEKVYATAAEAVADLERKHGPRSALWTYHDGHGEPCGVVVRWDRPDGEKDIRPVSRRGTNWIIGAMPEPRPLYQLPELLDDETGRRVYVCEGEKAADAASSLGLLSTTSCGGSQAAHKADWSPLAGREVVILPDNDDAGRRYADDVARIVTRLSPPARVRVVKLPDLPENGDTVEYIAARRSAGLDDNAIRAEIEALANAAALVELVTTETPATETGSSPVIVSLADVQPEPVRWFWPERIALGKLTLLAGDPGLGKSFITLDMAARVSTGTPWPDARDRPNPPGGVVLLSAEDDPGDTIRPRLDAAGANVARISLVEAVRFTNPETGAELDKPFSLTRDLSAMEEAIRLTPGCRLVIIDPITAYLGSTDSHVNAEVRAVLAPLGELARRHAVAIVAVTHLNKSSTMPAMYRSMGSLAFVAAARAVWAVSKDKDDPADRRRLFLPVKNNVGDDKTGLAYSLIVQAGDDVPCVVWEAEPVRVSADEVLRTDGNHDGERSDRQQAGEWLQDALANGAVRSTDLIRQAKDNGIAEKTLRRAFRDMGGKPRKASFGDGWYWALPGEDGHVAPEDGQDAHPTSVAIFGQVGHLGDEKPSPPGQDDAPGGLMPWREPERDEKGLTVVERAERYRRECGGYLPGTRPASGQGGSCLSNDGAGS